MTPEAMAERHDEVSQIRIPGQTAPRRPEHEACASRRLEAPPSSMGVETLVPRRHDWISFRPVTRPFRPRLATWQMRGREPHSESLKYTMALANHWQDN